MKREEREGPVELRADSTTHESPLRTPGQASASGHGRRLSVTKASDVQPRRVRWLWDRRIVLGGLTLLAGREGTGKSTVAVDLAAQVSTGRLDGEHHGTPGVVLYVATEDSIEHTVRPRLEAAGADLDRVSFVHAGADGQGLSLPSDRDDLEDLIRESGAVLVVLDAATSVMDAKLDGHNDRHMRQALEPTAGIANRTGVAVLGVVHFNKKGGRDTGVAILGTVAWSQVARSVLALGQEEGGSIVLTPTKANLAPTGMTSLALHIESAHVQTIEGASEVGRVVWEGETDQDARDLLVEADETNTSKRDRLAPWLSRYLKRHNGRVPAAQGAADVSAHFDASGSTVHRALKKLGVRSERHGEVWFWETEDAEKDLVSKSPLGARVTSCNHEILTTSRSQEEFTDGSLSCEDVKISHLTFTGEDDEEDQVLDMIPEDTVRFQKDLARSTRGASPRPSQGAGQRPRLVEPRIRIRGGFVGEIGNLQELLAEDDRLLDEEDDAFDDEYDYLEPVITTEEFVYEPLPENIEDFRPTNTATNTTTRHLHAVNERTSW